MSQAVVREIDDSRRSHCAIMFTDILGFTSLMHKDEQRTILKMESHKAQLELLHREFGGEIIQYYGDGSLSIFDDSQDAINCAIAIQNHVDRLKLPLKIGIHRGEIVRKGSAIYGDGVNIASRIESIGVEKSILFSEEFWQDIKHGGYQVKSLGSLRFKNVDKPIRVMGLVQNGLQIPSRNALEGKLQNRVGQRYRSYLMATVLVFLLAIAGLWRYNMYLNSLLKDDITTMGVMPFRFDGIGGMDASLKSGLLENLVTKLSSFYGMQVLSSRSTEAYANSTQKPTEIGEELGVSHLLFGTLRQGPDDSIRINMELVDVRNGRNIWAKSYNKKPEDFFGDPADISTDLAAFLEVRENPYKHEEPESKSRMSLTTFRLLTEAREEANRGTAQSFELSNDLLQLAISKDSTLALGYALLSQNYSLMHAYGFLDAEEALDLAERNGGIALYMDRNLAEGYASNALMQYVFFQSDPQEILDLLQEAVLLRPSYDYAFHLMGKVYYDLGDFEMASNYFDLAVKLNPDDFQNLRMQAKAVLAKGNNREARKLVAKISKKYPNLPQTKIDLASFYLATDDKNKLHKLLTEIPNGFNQKLITLEEYIKDHDFEKAENLIKQMSAYFPDQDPGMALVSYYDQSGQYDQAWSVLEKAIKAKSTWLKDVKNAGLNLATEDQDRYEDLLQSIGLWHQPG